MDHADLIVIGGGSGGLAAAKRAARHGARVVLVERDALGGTCVNRGCVPKKLLFRAAEQQQAMRYRMEGGLSAVEKIDFSRLGERIADKIGTLRSNFEDDLNAAGVRLIRGEAIVREDRTVKVGYDRLSADRILLATGARPTPLDIPGAEHLDYSDDVLSWRGLPARMLIIGGGYIGCEFAAIFRAFGVDVTLVQSSQRLLERFAGPAAEAAATNLNRQGVRLIFDAKPERIEPTGRGVAVTLDTGELIDTDRAVAAIGRTPNVDGLGPLSEMLETADSGALAISKRFETSVDNVHAIGDVADRLPLTPVATRDGECVADQLFGSGAEAIDLSLVATAAFVLPPVAQVGETGTEMDAVSGLTDDVLTGEVAPKLLNHLNFADDALVGACLIDPAAPELIAPLAAMIACGSYRGAAAAATGIHPSFAEEFFGR